jgi:hypothetical protein
MIESIDLEPIMVKIMDSEEGLGWSLEKAKKIALEYCRFLTLCKENPDLPIVPATDVDDFWHFHILDTYNYQEDCNRYFGYFLHHFPYFGMRDEKDSENLKKAWMDTCTLYESRFGEIDKTIWYASKRCPNCGRRCNNQILSHERPRLKFVA